MKTSLSHLPQNKQDQLKALTGIVLDKVPGEMIILFGSYARGDWVEDYQDKYEYVSDFDILIVTKDKNSAKQVKKSRELEEELMANEEITRTSIIYHSIGFVNDKIERNYYFFVDILKEGIMLFDSGKFALSEPKALNPTQRLENRLRNLSIGLKVLQIFFSATRIPSTERIIRLPFSYIKPRKDFFSYPPCFTDYKPRIHDIEILGNQVIKQHAEFATVFPMMTEEEKRLFVLLKKAYIDARYNRNYKIEKEELEYLGSRVVVLRDLTERVCRERIGQFDPKFYSGI